MPLFRDTPALLRSAPPRARAASSWPGANPWWATHSSPGRGRLITVPQDTRKQLQPYARIELTLKSRTFVEQYGPAKALNNLAALIGSLKPQANSGDPAWDVLAEAAFNRIANSAIIFDASGKRTFSTWQTFTTFRRFTDGDIFSVLTSTTSGAARIAGRESHQVFGGEGKDWIDGVRTDSNGFPLAYNFKNLDDTGKNYVLQGRDVHHHAAWTTLGGTRGTPALAHCLNDFHDMVEIKQFVKRAIKTAALMGLSRKIDKSSVNGQPPGNYGAGASLDNDVYEMVGSSTTGEVVEKPVTVEDVLDAGIMSSVPVEAVHDERPHPNAEEFKKSLLREASVGLGVPPAILFFMDDPGGAWIRTQLDIFARFIFDQHANYLLPFCQRFWTYAIAREMLAGRLPYPSKGEFWRVRWTPPRSITADMGNMGKLLIDLRKACLTTFANHYEQLGLDYESELEQCAKEAQLLIKLEKDYKLPDGMLTNALLPVNFAQPDKSQDKATDKAA